MIEATKRAEQARAMSSAWTHVAMAWDAVDRCTRYRPAMVGVAAQEARACEDAAKEGDVELVDVFFKRARSFGYPE